MDIEVKINDDKPYEKEILEVNQCYSEDSDGKRIWKHNKLASYMINKCKIYNINDNLYMFDEKEGIYKKGDAHIETYVLNFNNAFKTNFRKEVVNYLKLTAPELKYAGNLRYIGCKNGVYDIVIHQMIPYRDNMFLLQKIDTDYNPEAKNDAVDAMLNKVCCHKDKVRSVVEEMIGYCLLRDCRFGKSFLLKGEGKNGKSTLLKTIQNMLGEDNYSALSMVNLNEKFKKAELEGKLANFCDDMSNAFIEDAGDFKKVITGGVMTVERKGQDPFKLYNYAKMIMCANDYPRGADKSEGWNRRFIMIPFDAEIKETDPDYDPNIDEKLATEEAKSYLLNLAIAGLERLLSRGRFEETDEMKEEKEAYKKENNPILSFVEEYGKNNIIGKNTQSVYEDYVSWCAGQGIGKFNKPNFTRLLKTNFGIGSDPKTIMGNSVRVYVVKEQTQKAENKVIYGKNDILPALKK